MKRTARFAAVSVLTIAAVSWWQFQAWNSPQRICNATLTGSRFRYTPATANRHLSLFSRMMKLAVTLGFIDKNPAVGIRKAQENNERHRYFSGALNDPGAMELSLEEIRVS